MNYLVLSGSRNRNGQTARAVHSLVEGIKQTGHQTEELFLPELKIERCRQCNDNGWGDCISAGTCVIDDDFKSIVDKIKKVNTIIFATPVYFSDLSESLRAFLDRFRRIAWQGGEHHLTKGKKAYGVCVAGGGGGGAPECSAILRKILTHCGFEIGEIVPVRRQNLEEKIPVLYNLGKQLSL